MISKRKPAHVVKLGLVEAAIWKNGTSEKPFFNVTLRRCYSVEENGQMVWRDTESLGRDDLLLAAKALDVAHSWICDQVAKRESVESGEAEPGRAEGILEF